LTLFDAIIADTACTSSDEKQGHDAIFETIVKVGTSIYLVVSSKQA
jgi:hypothetical protein